MIHQIITDYRPTHVPSKTWESIAEVARSAVSYSAMTEQTARRHLSHISPYAAWAYHEGVPLNLAQLMEASTIERYIEVGMPDAKDSTRATRRSILRRIARHSHPSLAASPDPLPLAYRRVRAPYEAHEVASYFRLAEAQPSQGRRKSLLAVLLLGLGCGLDCADLGWVRGLDVRSTDEGVAVAVGGRRPRRVVCFSRYEDRLAALALAAAGDLLIGGSMLGRHNVTSVTLGRLLQDTSVPPLVVSRLRSTWLAAHLAANTPLPLIMGAAGLKTVRPLEDLLDFAPGYSNAEASRLLRAAG